jgi:hypothetical protein
VQSDDPVTGVTMTSISNAAGGSLLGATQVVVGLALTAGPTLGLSFIEIEGLPNAVWNAQGQVATRLSTGYFRLRDPRNLLNAYEWSFDKFLDNSPNASWDAVNVVGTTALYHSGLRSVYMADPTGVYTDRSITLPNDLDPLQRIVVVGGATYKISAWVYVMAKTTGTAADTGIRLRLKMGRTGSGPLVSGGVATVPAMGGWYLVEQTVQAPADSNGSAWMVVQAADINPNDSDVYVDDLRMTLQ